MKLLSIAVPCYNSEGYMRNCIESLLPGGDYPAPDCRSPLRPLPGDSPMDWRMYRSDMEAYRQCVEAYLATARQDAERIRKRMEKAVREYNEESGNL